MFTLKVVIFLLTKDIPNEVKNHRDLKVIDKYNQLKKLGFTNVYIYFGGLFEWLMLREIYGDINFPITSQCSDILIYK